MTDQQIDSDPIIELVIRFNDALNAQDASAMMQLMTEDCVFENTYPPPDGARYEGQASVRVFWEDFFRSSQNARIEIEEIFASNERCTMRWIYRWIDMQGKPGHVRGVDIYRIVGGKIKEKLSYVKG